MSESDAPKRVRVSRRAESTDKDSPRSDPVDQLAGILTRVTNDPSLVDREILTKDLRPEWVAALVRRGRWFGGEYPRRLSEDPEGGDIDLLATRYSVTHPGYEWISGVALNREYDSWSPYSWCINFHREILVELGDFNDLYFGAHPGLVGFRTRTRRSFIDTGSILFAEESHLPGAPSALGTEAGDDESESSSGSDSGP